MMRPQRVGEGADHELIAGLLGAAVVVDDMRDLLAWIADDAGSGEPPAASSDLADALLGVAALIAGIDRRSPIAGGGDPDGERRALDGDDPPPAAPRIARDLLR
jgi:hypothetical protein